MIERQEQMMNILLQMMKQLPENELLFLKKIIECLVVKASILNSDTNRITAASLKGKYKDIPVSSYELMQEKKEEVEREIQRYEEHFEK